MTFLHALVLGIVEGITEFLPISSTAHLQIASELLGLIQTDFVKSFEIIIQLGAILAVVVVYARVLLKKKEVWKKISAAFIPTGIIGFVLYKVIKEYLIGNNTIIIWTLAIGGVILIIFELVYRHDAAGEGSIDEIEQMSYRTALIIGTAQALAVIPGVSRSATTIITGRTLGLSRKAVIEFSFLLAIPTMAAATGYDLVQNASLFSASQLGVLGIGFIAAFLSALVAIKFLLAFIQTRSFVFFGIYRIILAFMVFLLIYVVH